MNAQLETTDDTFDKIEKYYQGKVHKLTPKEVELVERWELAFALLLKHRNKKVSVTKYLAICERRGNALSPASAYRDFDNAEKIFLPIKKYSKDFLRLTLIESAFRDVKICDEMMRKSNDPKVFSELMKAKDKAEMRIIKASGLDINDPNMPDFAKLNVGQVNINMDPKVQNMLKALLKKGAVDATDLFKEAQDVESEDVTDTE